jgi:hypothetical protein
MGNRMKRFLAVAGLGMLSISSSVFALEYPEPPNPAAQSLIAQYKQDKPLVDSPTLFDIPNPIPAWPCAVSEAQQYKMAGLDRMHPELKADYEKMMKKAFRDVGMSAAQRPKETYSNIQIIPLRAQCKEGQLDGELELLVSYDQRTDMTTKTMLGEKVVTGTTVNILHHISRTSRIVNMGKLAFASKTYSQMTIQIETHYDDERMETSNKKTNASLGLNKPTATKNITYTAEDKTMAMFMESEDKEVSGGLFGVKVKTVPSLTVMITIPIDENHSRMETYKNKQLISTAAMKEGKMHGEQIIYMDNYLKKLKMRLDQQSGMENAREVTINGVDLIEMHNCYQNGTPIKINPCPQE